jgi:Cu+-exporting ATPase
MKTEGTIEWKVTGMSCSSCAATVTKYLQKQGATEVYVNFASDEVRFKKDEKDLNRIAEGINSLGYKVVTPVSEAEIRKWYALDTLERRFWFTVPFTVLLLLHMFIHWHILHNPLVQLTLSIPVVMIGFIQFGRSAWHSVKLKSPNMDVLIFMGSTSAFVYSVVGYILFKDEGEKYLFFETAATIITLVLFGNLLEKRSVMSTTKAITELAKLQPTKALKILKDLLSGKEVHEEIAVKDVKINDLLLLKTGDRIPLDGLVITGNAAVDESIMTGESLTVGKAAGSSVLAGTLLIDGHLTIKVTKGESGTLLSQVIELVKTAQTDKPNIQRLGDRVSAIFVPAVVLIAIIAFIINYYIADVSVADSLMRSVAVLVISCPCAMGLATPLAVIVGIGKAAAKGILIKGGSTLETFTQINCIVFDKTGTLTTGAFHISNFKVYDFLERDAKNIIHYFETFSNHPIAKCIIQQHADWHHHNIAFDDIKEIKGQGIKAKDHFGNVYTLGSLKLADGLKASKDEMDIYLTRNNTIIAGFNVNDEIKAEASDAIAQLKAAGIKTILLSGDSERKCKEVAAQLNIDEVYSRQLPEQKNKLISKLAKTYMVAMVGDGVNDAPALARAHVGISLGNATDIAKQAAKIIFLQNRLDRISHTFSISKLTYRTIKQNLFWALLYNVTVIPLAAMGMLNPMVAALGMAFSDLVVIGNSLRIHNKK